MIVIESKRRKRKKHAEEYAEKPLLLYPKKRYLCSVNKNIYLNHTPVRDKK